MVHAYYFWLFPNVEVRVDCLAPHRYCALIGYDWKHNMCFGVFIEWTLLWPDLLTYTLIFSNPKKQIKLLLGDTIINVVRITGHTHYSLWSCKNRWRFISKNLRCQQITCHRLLCLSLNCFAIRYGIWISDMVQYDMVWLGLV